ncbi:MAG: LysM peptidoglycan-binding domain-containing protein [Chloroflexi bacterium]|nr:LysM peptidoglycan-binding domain-containing protein [Chloroflexota bacterium]
MKKILVLVLLLIVLAVPMVLYNANNPAAAQGTNLIQNGAMSANWAGLPNNKGQVPQPWRVWAVGEAPISDIHQFVEEYRSAPASWVFHCDYLTCHAGGYQQVNGTAVGTTYRFTIHAFLWTCNDNVNSCRDANGRYADEESNARVRVGIDPTGGADASSPNIVWSAYSKPWMNFEAPLTVDAVATAGSITVFTEWRQDVAMFKNEVYWDDASLAECTAAMNCNPLNPGAATTDDDDDDSTDPVVEPPQTVPFVQPQSARPDGSVVHVVGEGDTFLSIAVAYRHVATRDEILAINEWEAPPGIITIGQEIKILPPGSVDPDTGRLLNQPGQQATTAPTPPPPPSGDATQVPTPPPPPPSDNGEPSATGVGPSTPRIDPDVEKGGSLIPKEGAPSNFFAFSKRRVTITTVHQGNGSGTVCVKFFEDLDSDLLHTNTESIISGGSFTLDKTSYDVNDLTCIDNVQAGRQTLTASAPSGYGFISSPELEVRVFPNRDVLVEFSLQQGAAIPDSAPAVEEEPLVSTDIATVVVEEDKDSDISQFLSDYASYIMFAVAGLVGLVSMIIVWSYRR